jgi:hypothetical protein
VSAIRGCGASISSADEADETSAVESADRVVALSAGRVDAAASTA